MNLKVIRTIAHEMLNTAKGDWAEAARLYHKYLTQHEAVTPDLLDYAIQHIIREVARRSRRVKWNESQSGGAANPTMSRDVKTLVSTLLMEYPLRGGMLMKDATRPVLKAEAAFLQSQVNATAARARWFGAVCRRLPNDHVTVGEILTEKQQRQLKNAAGVTAA